MQSCYKRLVPPVRQTPSMSPRRHIAGHFRAEHINFVGDQNLYKRQLAACAAAFTTVGALVPAAAYAATAVNGQGRALPVAPLSASSLFPAGHSVGARATSHTVRSHAAGPLAPVLSSSDLGLLTVAAYPSDTNSATPTATGIAYSVNFGDGSAAVSVTAGPVNHTYAKPGTYTITETETDSAGDSATASLPYTTMGTNFTAYGPTRLLDTRNGTGAAQGAVAAGGVIKLKVAGVGSIPANAQAVVLNVTVTAPTAAGAIAAYPDGTSAPGTVSVNFAAGQTVATLAVATLGSGGTVDLVNSSSGTVQVIADVTGYFTPVSASGYTSLSPARLLDTRKGIGAPTGVVGQGQAVTLTVAGADGGQLPSSGIKAVALNVTVTGTVGGGYITAYPDGTARPTASNVNFNPGDTLANMVIVPVGADGKIDLYNSSTGTQIIADVDGYFSASGTSAYGPLAPQRIDDSTSDGAGPLPGAGVRELGLIETLDSTVNPAAPVPFALGMTGFVLTTTVKHTAQGGYLTVYPFGATRPVVSNLNFTPGQTVANLALATPGLDSAQNVKAIDYYNGSSGSFDVTTDLAGFFGTY